MIDPKNEECESQRTWSGMEEDWMVLDQHAYPWFYTSSYAELPKTYLEDFPPGGDLVTPTGRICSPMNHSCTLGEICGKRLAGNDPRRLYIPKARCQVRKQPLYWIITGRTVGR
jgi:hypothetical protein